MITGRIYKSLLDNGVIDYIVFSIGFHNYGVSREERNSDKFMKLYDAECRKLSNVIHTLFTTLSEYGADIAGDVIPGVHVADTIYDVIANLTTALRYGKENMKIRLMQAAMVTALEFEGVLIDTLPWTALFHHACMLEESCKKYSEMEDE